MSESTAALQIWGAVLIKNKLLDQAKWDEVLALHRKAEGRTSISELLLQKHYLSAKGVDVVGKKVAEVIARQQTAATSKPAAAAGVAAPAKTAVAAAPPAGNAGEIQLAEPADGAAAKGWRPSDADWVESAPQAKPAASNAKGHDDEQIPLVGDDELSAPLSGPSKVIVDDRPYIAPKKAPAASARPAKKTSLTSAESPEEERIESPVPPGQLHPEAFGYLKKAVEMGASDLHLAAGCSPFVRLHGSLKFFDAPKITPEVGKLMVLGFMDDMQQQRYLRHHDVDFAFEHPDVGRCRVNALEQFRGPDIIFRLIPKKALTLTELGLPQSLEKFTEWHQGLVLVTGPAGCGKSTTAAALIDLVNSRRKDHIITVEDPIEFLHRSKGCNVTQRQVITHTKSFAAALKAALREDPDVIMIGEMRDLETVSLAIRAAETGHLVIGTLQTKSAARTIDRVVDVFPADQQAQIRTMLSESLRGVISQQLIPRIDGKGRVVALEVLHVNNAVSNLIRDSKTYQLPSLMQTGRKIGQKLMDDSIEELLQAGTITRDEAAKAAENPKRFRHEPTAPAAETKGKK